MKIDSVVAFLKTIPHSESSSGRNIMVRCPFCGDSAKHSDSKHLSIKVDVEKGTPMLYQCFQPSYRCGAKGVVTTTLLQKLGCTKMQPLIDLSSYNRTINVVKDKFNVKVAREYTLVNTLTQANIMKAEYINNRLGINFTPSEMKKLKIQLSLLEFLNMNGIKRRFFSKDRCDLIDSCTVGFVSAYDDYLICRDVTKKLRTGSRYTMYNASGNPSANDMKLYIIPTTIDLMSSKSTTLHIAEGPFSILGAYLHCDMEDEGRNNIFIANCGTGYRNSIEHIVKQYGFCKLRINIYSDSEVPMKEYEKLYQILSNRYDVRKFQVHYNTKKEDFGYPAKFIDMKTCTIK